MEKAKLKRKGVKTFVLLSCLASGFLVSLHREKLNLLTEAQTSETGKHFEDSQYCFFHAVHRRVSLVAFLSVSVYTGESEPKTENTAPEVESQCRVWIKP